jgi:hypothetical protein
MVSQEADGPHPEARICTGRKEQTRGPILPPSQHCVPSRDFHPAAEPLGRSMSSLESHWRLRRWQGSLAESTGQPRDILYLSLRSHERYCHLLSLSLVRSLPSLFPSTVWPLASISLLTSSIAEAEPPSLQPPPSQTQLEHALHCSVCLTPPSPATPFCPTASPSIPPTSYTWLRLSEQ